MNDSYCAYLLRLRRSQPTPHWRVVLENVHTGEVLHFATETELLRYLLRVLTEQSQQPRSNDGEQSF